MLLNILWLIHCQLIILTSGSGNMYHIYTSVMVQKWPIVLAVINVLMFLFAYSFVLLFYVVV